MVVRLVWAEKGKFLETYNAIQARAGIFFKLIISFFNPNLAIISRNYSENFYFPWIIYN
jgi:hypothetical protein